MTTMPRKRALWSEDALASAVQAVQRGILSTYKAAARYGVPRRTIRNHLKSGNLKKTLGRKTILNNDQETDLVNRIIRFADIGLPVTTRILRRLVYKFCEVNDIKHSFNKNMRLAGKDWYKAFMKRHPEISKRKAQFMNPARAQKLNKFIVDDHFERINEIYNQLDLKDHPERIYNMDEKGCRLTIHHQQAVLAKKGAKRVHLVSSEHAESVTVAGCVNALGTAIPPMIIFKGKRLKPELYDNLPAGSLVEKSSKGYMNNELFKEFLKHLARYKSGGKCLLVFDGAACHLDLSIVEVADSLNISLYCLPSNTTHELQPLDKAVYRSFEHHWDAEVLLFLDQNPDKKITKARFNVILTNVWSKCMTHSNITSGFKATGLYPLNPQAIPETAFAPSILSEAPAPPVSDAVEEEILGCSSPAEVPLTPTRSSPISSSPEMLLALTNNSPTMLNRSPSEALTPVRPTTSRSRNMSPSGTLSSTNSTPVRPAGSFYRTVYNSSTSDDDEDNMPLIQLKKTAFQDLMPTPLKALNKTPTIRKKAINYRGTPVTKDLFDKKAKENKSRNSKVKSSMAKKKNTSKSKGRENKIQEIWYCHGCQEDKVADMRKCVKCGKWYHEECVGLSATDTENFECPNGC
ncbi:uncharacterized protein LOC134804559 [Cydia splendana]|uniref:uncharacterized protein LOC134804559 n=1 Tax=Cydia splendana TaxID=1100963 RepID=UPI00300D3E11